jgi:hypothetical protein
LWALECECTVVYCSGIESQFTPNLLVFDRNLLLQESKTREVKYGGERVASELPSHLEVSQDQDLSTPSHHQNHSRPAPRPKHHHGGLARQAVLPPIHLRKSVLFFTPIYPRPLTRSLRHGPSTPPASNMTPSSSSSPSSPKNKT